MPSATGLILATLILVGGCRSPYRSAAYAPSDYPTTITDAESRGVTLVQLTPEALRIHHSATLVDGHNDLPGEIRTKGASSFDKIDIAKPQPQLQTDIERLQRGGVGAQFWSAYVPVSTITEGGATRYALEQIDLIHRMVERYPDVFQMAYTADDIERVRGKGKIASLIGVEGGHAIENSLGVLRMFHALGVRYITLTHTKSLDWCDSCNGDPISGGLSPFGEDVIREMNRLGILVDISHISADAMRHVLRVTKAPVIASHSSAYAVAQHVRNVPDDVLAMMKNNGGVIMANFYSGFVDPDAAKQMPERFKLAEKMMAEHADKEEGRKAVDAYFHEHPMPRGTLQTVVDHINHMVKVAGIDHVGIGSDFDGIDRTPTQLDDVSYFPYVTQELLNRGYSENDIRKILGGNVIRAFQEAEAVSDK